MIFLVAIAAIWLVMILVTNPTGNFPLNDDWTYARGIKHLVEHGRLDLWRGAYALSIGNLPWGTLFCLPFGFSFVALRVSSLVLGLIGVLSVYGIAREAGARPAVACIAALSLAVNPAYYSLSSTFMTDVPCTAYSAIAIFCFVRALKNQCVYAVICGTIAACLAAATRQFAVLIPLAYLAAQLYKAGFGVKSVARAVVPLLVTILVLILSPGKTLSPNHILSATESTNGAIQTHIGKYLAGFGQECLIAVAYLGLYALPIVLLLPWWRWLPAKLSFRRTETGPRPAKKRAAAVARNDGGQPSRALVTVSALILLGGLTWLGIAVQKVILVCLGGNIIYNCGLGPTVLKDIYFYGLWRNLPGASRQFWAVVSVIGFVSGGIVVAVVARTLWNTIASFRDRVDRDQRAAALFSLIGFVALAVPICAIATATKLLDRYLLLTLPFLVAIPLISIGSSFRPTRVQVTLAVAALVLLGGFSVAGTHDYLSWNRARWQALDSLLRDKISPKDIDGGYEFNGWYTWPNTWVPQFNSGRSWWVLYNDKYVLSFGPQPFAKTLRRYPYSRWIPRLETDHIYVGESIDPWKAPPGANWVLKDNPYIAKAVLCRVFHPRFGLPFYVVSKLPAGSRTISMVYKMKKGARADIVLTTYINGVLADRAVATGKPGRSGAITLAGAQGLPPGSYRSVIQANGMNVGEFSLTVE